MDLLYQWLSKFSCWFPSNFIDKTRLTVCLRTGITGYIGGDVFFALSKAHSDFEYSALVRTEDRARTITEVYPAVRIVLGSLDDSELLEEEASKADIVIRG